MLTFQIHLFFFLLINTKHCSQIFSAGCHEISPFKSSISFLLIQAMRLTLSRLIMELITSRSTVCIKTKVLQRSQKYSSLKEMSINQYMKPFLLLNDSFTLLNAELN
jgi:hypothetical protein